MKNVINEVTTTGVNAAAGKGFAAAGATVQAPVLVDHVQNSPEPIEIGQFLVENGIMIGGDLLSISGIISIVGAIYLLHRMGLFKLIKWIGLSLANTIKRIASK